MGIHGVHGVLNYAKGLDGRPHWDCGVCSILADLGTEFSSLEPRLFVHPHRAFIFPSTPTCLAYYVKPLVRVFHSHVGMIRS